MSKRPDYDKQISLIDERIAELKAQRISILKKKEAANNKEVIDIFKGANISIEDFKKMVSLNNSSKTLSLEENKEVIDYKDDREKENTEKEKNDK